mmetsp:Transcript_59614/g.136745  ORF Transcript_59614/g.136745 Transcript_59614/m.136745 type:complete len:270 (+) Transcript_59614:1459-2268(+)
MRLNRSKRHRERLKDQLLGRHAADADAALEAFEHRDEEDGAIADLIVVVVDAPLQQHDDGGAERIDHDAKLRERAHRRGAHRRVLEDDAVVDEADVLGRLGRGGALDAEQVQDLRREQRELAILDELAQVREPSLLGLADAPYDREQRVHDGLLVRKTALLAQHVREESHQQPVLLRELEAHSADGIDHNDLKIVGYLRHEGSDLLHQPLHARLGTRLEQRRDGERRNRTVRIVDQPLHVHVARRHRQRVRHRQLVQSAHRRKPARWLG